MAKAKKVELYPVEEFAKKTSVPGWELAALRQATGWAAGKQTTQDEFDSALDKLRNRPQGGGRI